MRKLLFILFFCTATAAVSLAQVNVLPNGNVGVGILAPSTVFHIKGMTPFMTYENTVSPYKIWQMGITGSNFSIVEATGGTRLFIQNTTGNVGINTSSNLYSALNVNGGINITSADSAYRISNNPILRVKGTGSLFVGSEAGKNTSGNYNTFNGFEAGYTNSTGTYSTFMGYQSGYSNTTASYNTFVGSLSGVANTTGYNNVFTGYQSGNANTTGHDNVFTGYQSGIANTTASYNTFNGGLSGYTNTTGAGNTFTGYQSGKNNTASNNNFFGYQAGYNNTTGTENTFIGSAGVWNTTGYENTFVGYIAGHKNTTGYYNTFTGYKAGYNNVTGYENTFNGDFAGYSTTNSDNTALGYYAGQGNTSGSNNTFIGKGADAYAGTYSYATAIGSGAIVLGGSRIQLGNTTTDVYQTNGHYYTSDGRFKFNIQENVKGLEFINKLRPVTYQMNTQQLDNFVIQNMPDSIKIMHQTGMDFAPSTAVVHSGFVAQEVDSAAQICGFTSSIVHSPSDVNDVYALSYSEIVVPLVKAVQELNATITQQGLEIQALNARLDACCKSTIPASGN